MSGEGKTKIIFQCECSDTKPGEVLMCIGSHDCVGNWVPSKSLLLKTDHNLFPKWIGEVKTDVDNIEFKFAVVKDNNVSRWEDGPNRHLKDISACEVDYKSKFGQQATTRAEIRAKEECPKIPLEASPEAEDNFSTKWMGDHVEAIRERVATGLKRKCQESFQQSEIADNAFGKILSENNKCPTYLSKLKLVHQILQALPSIPDYEDGDEETRVNQNASGADGGLLIVTKPFSQTEISGEGKIFAQWIDTIVVVHLYLSLIKRGLIVCNEENEHSRRTHYRPDHHAKESKNIFIFLDQMLRKIAGRTDSFADALRQFSRCLMPQLPRFDDQYIVTEPLTRIRDIAHRDDIPQDLKNRLKLVQNKLHRSAGPEDLYMAEALLEEFKKNPSNYPKSFLLEYEKFIEELRGFFNASSLGVVLKSLEEKSTDQTLNQLISQYFMSKSNDNGKLFQVVGLAESLCELRRHVCELLDVPSQKENLFQLLRTCDILLSEQLFICLSRLETSLDSSFSKDLLEITEKCFRQLAQTGLRKEESFLIADDLKIFVPFGDDIKSVNHLVLLNLRAILERGMRLCETCSGMLASIMEPRANDFSDKFNLDRNKHTAFVEGNVRAHLVFQVSKFVQKCQQALRLATGTGYYDTIVAGEAVGKLRKEKNLRDVDWSALTEPTILLLQSIDGEEDMMFDSKQAYLVGILVCHDVPHLSHFAIRSRETGLVAVSVLESKKIEWLNNLKEVFLCIKATSGEATLLEVSPQEAETSLRKLWLKSRHGKVSTKGSSENLSVATVLEAPSKEPDAFLPSKVIADQAKAAKLHKSIGSKAAQLAKLHLLSEISKKFIVPKSIYLMFGILEDLIVKDWATFAAIHQKIISDPEEESAHKEMDSFIQNLEFPKEQVAAVMNHITHWNVPSLAVRSSSSAEDGLDTSAAGIYSSVLNVDSKNEKEVINAVKNVYKSLFSANAVMSRRIFKSNVPPRMGVIIQALVEPKYFFVAHSRDPFDDAFPKSSKLYVEIFPGMGMSLANAAGRGSPHRVKVNRDTKEIEILSFCNYSATVKSDTHGHLQSVLLNYREESFIHKMDFRTELTSRICEVVKFLEETEGCPQDVEGVWTEDGNVSVVQMRPQLGTQKVEA
eukprot:GHVP01007083.1.p1 GENE.GHVP01007083.1~~GHVP01007083.1.p1  ORF type:complete len:1127 (-),score=218.31 GHVP01007083.1:43-3423(-)